MKAYLYGSEVVIMDFHIAKHGNMFCKVRILENNWIDNVPVSCIDIR